MTKMGNLCIWLLVTPTAFCQGGTTSLQSLIAEAKANNPAIQTSERAVSSSRYGAKQASALPDTEIMVQHVSVGSPRPFAGYSNSDFSYIGFGASQELPFPGKRELRAKMAEQEVAISRAENNVVAWDVLTRLKLAYFAIASSQQVIAILERNQLTAEQMVESAEARYRVGQGAEEDVLRAQLERTRLLNDISRERRQNAQAQAVLKALLNRAIGSPDVIAESLRERRLPPTEQLLQRLADQNPDVLVSGQRILEGHAALDSAQREKKPDFGVQYMWQHTASEFRDYYMATFSLKLPNRSRVRAMEGEASAKLSQAESEKQARLKQMEGDLGEQIATAEASAQQLKVFDDGLIPQSQAALDAGLASYSAGRQQYQGLLASFADTLALTIERERTLAEHESAIARIEALIGEELP